ncbi:MAG: hypothetical protein ABSG20_34715, partial [Bradyrhizobium sp.]
MAEEISNGETQVVAATDPYQPEPQAIATMDPAKPELPALAADVPLLRIEGVVKTFGRIPAVDQLSLDIRAGEFFA